MTFQGTGRSIKRHLGLFACGLIISDVGFVNAIAGPIVQFPFAKNRQE